MFMHTGVEGKFKISLLTAAFIIAGCSSHVGQIKPVYKSPNEVRVSQASDGELYQQGKFYFQKGQYGKAIASFERVLARNPKSIMAMNGLGASYDQLKRYQIAMRYYHRALQIDPDSAVTLNNLGFSLALQGRSERAEDVFDLALSNDPNNPYAIANRETIVGGETEKSGADIVVVPKVAEAPATQLVMQPEKTGTVEKEALVAARQQGDESHVDRAGHAGEIAAVPEDAPAPKSTIVAEETTVLTANSVASESALSEGLEDKAIFQAAQEGALLAEDIDVQPAVVLTHPVSVDTTWADSEWPEESQDLTAELADEDSVVTLKERVVSPSDTLSEVTIDTSWADSQWIDESERTASQKSTDRSETDALALEQEAPVPQITSLEVDIDTGWADIKWIDEAVVDSTTAITHRDGNSGGLLQPENSFVVRIVPEAQAENSEPAGEGPRTITLSQEAETPAVAFRVPATELSATSRSAGETRPLLFGPTKPGHTLWDISLQLSQQQGSDHAQMLTALAYSNPEAFINGDMNLLKVGYMLWVPGAQEITNTSVPAFAADEGVLGNLSVEVSNGNGRRGIANMIAGYLKNKGANVASITNAQHYQMQVSVIYYKTDHQEDALQLAAQLPIQPILKEANKSVDGADVRLVLGQDLLEQESEIRKVFLNKRRA